MKPMADRELLAQRHDEDLKLLDQAIEAVLEKHMGEPALDDSWKVPYDAFHEMKQKLEARGSRAILTEKQRDWAAKEAGVETYVNAWSSGKVPRGREVETPDVLKPHNLPKKPPGRR